MTRPSEFDIQQISGPALLYAYILALGQVPLEFAGNYSFRDAATGHVFTPKISRYDAADLIADRWISVDRPSPGQKTPIFRCVTNYTGNQVPFETVYVVSAHSSDFAEAVFRCFVASKFGEKLRVLPKEHAQPLSDLVAAATAAAAA